MEDSLLTTVLVVTAVNAGIGAQVLAKYLHIPSIVFLLLFGIILGSSGIGLLDPSLLGSGLEVIVSLAISLILFEGGMSFEIAELGNISLRNLLTIGVAISFAGGTLVAHYICEFPWSLSVLYASLIVVTGPTVVTPLLKLIKVDRRVATLLEGEGILIDPLGAILAVITLNIVISDNVEPLILFRGLFLRLGIGITLGLLAGGLLRLVLVKRLPILPQKLKNLVVLSTVWSAFTIAQILRSESGLLVAVVTGIVLRAAALPGERLLRQFKAQLGLLANSILFILLAADLSIASITALGWKSVIAVLVLMLVVRPLSILASTWNQGYSWQQQLFLAWIAPRGIVAASLASLFAISLTAQGIAGGEALKALVFLTILMTVSVQGLTAGWVASSLGLRTEPVSTVIVGNHPLTQLLTKLLNQKGESTLLVELDAEPLSQDRFDHSPAFRQLLQLEELESEGISALGNFLALTQNSELNRVLAQQSLELFHPRTIAILPQPSDSEKSLSASDFDAVFALQVSIESWNQAFEQDLVKIVEVVLRSPTLAIEHSELSSEIETERFMPLLVEREQKLRIVLVGEAWQAEDRITGLMYDSALANLSKSDRDRFTTIALEPSELVESPP